MNKYSRYTCISDSVCLKIIKTFTVEEPFVHTTLANTFYMTLAHVNTVLHFQVLVTTSSCHH